MRTKSILMGIFGLGAALVVHAGILLFGGWFFLKEEGPPKSTIPVDLLDPNMDDKKKDEKKEDPKDQEEQVAENDEPPPDAESIVRNLEEPATNAAPALDDASLSEIANALNGGGGLGGEFFAGATSLEGGGVIGGTGKRGADGEDPIETAFEMADIDQKARAVFQSSPTYPTQMRGKKVEGVVTLIFVVDQNGKVESPKVESSSHTAFEGPALAAVKKWKFEPGVRGGERVASKVRISIRFPPA
ncbi:MAG: TonB family protein [Phycisphaerae bacterium]|jgi:protein TonB|nr:TonB family protein [Phycisphaerae bacterium]